MTVIAGFEKAKIWGGMSYGALSELVILPENKGDEKLNAKTMLLWMERY